MPVQSIVNRMVVTSEVMGKAIITVLAGLRRQRPKPISLSVHVVDNVRHIRLLAPRIELAITLRSNSYFTLCSLQLDDGEAYHQVRAAALDALKEEGQWLDSDIEAPVCLQLEEESRLHDVVGIPQQLIILMALEGTRGWSHFVSNLEVELLLDRQIPREEVAGGGMTPLVALTMRLPKDARMLA